MKLTIIVPVYNEEKTILNVLKSLGDLKIDLNKEIIIVDDGSKDNSNKIISEFIRKNKYDGTEFMLINKKNGGKGSAVKKGIESSSGDIITIQDADLEYNPIEYGSLVQPIIRGESEVVYGSRFLRKHKPRYRIYFWGNKFLSLLTKILYGAEITDMETCYKVFKRDTIKSLNIKSNKFDIEPEITAKLLNKGIRIREVPISYMPRSIKDGKKIGWKDGIKAIYILLKYKFVN